MSDARSIRVDWQPVSSLNGAIERYVLYVSTTSKSVGEVVYNSSTELLAFHTVINNLTAGTLHFIRLAVSSQSDNNKPALLTSTTL